MGDFEEADYEVDLSTSDEEDEVCRVDAEKGSSDAKVRADLEATNARSIDDQSNSVDAKPLEDDTSRPKPKKMPKRMAKKPPAEESQAKDSNTRNEATEVAPCGPMCSGGNDRPTAEALAKVDVKRRAVIGKLKELLLAKDDKKSEEKRKHRARITLTSEEEIKTTSVAIATLRAWLVDASRKDETRFEIIETNGFLRRFIHEACADEFPDLIVVSKPTEKKGVSKMFALRYTEEQALERIEQLERERDPSPKFQRLNGSSSCRPKALQTDVPLNSGSSRTVPDGVKTIRLKRGNENIANSVDTSAPRVIERQACRLWARSGMCKFGDACRFSHERRQEVSIPKESFPSVADEELVPDWKRRKTVNVDRKMHVAEMGPVETQAKLTQLVEEIEAVVDPYLGVDSEAFAEGGELANADTMVEIISHDEECLDEENPIAAEFRMAFEELPQTEGTIADEFMNAFDDLPDRKVKPTRSLRLQARNVMGPQESTFSSPAVPDKQIVEGRQIAASCPEMKFARQYLAHRRMDSEK